MVTGDEANREAATTERAIRFLTSPCVLRGNLATALLVGTILSAVNQAEALLYQEWTAVVWLKILFNFLIPFAVASVSSALNRNG